MKRSWTDRGHEELEATVLSTYVLRKWDGEQQCRQSVCKITRLLEVSACLPTLRCEEEGEGVRIGAGAEANLQHPHGKSGILNPVVKTRESQRKAFCILIVWRRQPFYCSQLCARNSH